MEKIAVQKKIDAEHTAPRGHSLPLPAKKGPMRIPSPLPSIGHLLLSQPWARKKKTKQRSHPALDQYKTHIYTQGKDTETHAEREWVRRERPTIDSLLPAAVVAEDYIGSGAARPGVRCVRAMSILSPNPAPLPLTFAFARAQRDDDGLSATLCVRG